MSKEANLQLRLAVSHPHVRYAENYLEVPMTGMRAEADMETHLSPRYSIMRW